MTSDATWEILVEHELSRARDKHPAPFSSQEDALAVILKQWHDTQAKALRAAKASEVLRDLVQVAAMCRRMSEDCRLLDMAKEER